DLAYPFADIGGFFLGQILNSVVHVCFLSTTFSRRAGILKHRLTGAVYQTALVKSIPASGRQAAVGDLSFASTACFYNPYAGDLLTRGVFSFMI
ncbi:MAG: hypothetical protein IJI97_05515, partial [Clostridia bacterium]|nr:hypothetical protein [Clostridia bacterium]